MKNRILSTKETGPITFLITQLTDVDRMNAKKLRVMFS